MANKFTFGSGSFGNTGTFGKTNENAGAGKSRAPFVQFDDLDDDQKTQYQAGYKDWLDQNPDDYVGAALHGEDRLFTWQNNSKYFNDQGGIVSGALNTGASALRPSMQFDDLNDDDKRRYQLGYKSVYDPKKKNFLEAASAGEAAVRETRLSLDQQLGESMLGDLGKPRDQMPLYLKDPAYIADLLRMNGATEEQMAGLKPAEEPAAPGMTDQQRAAYQAAEQERMEREQREADDRATGAGAQVQQLVAQKELERYQAEGKLDANAEQILNNLKGINNEGRAMSADGLAGVWDAIDAVRNQEKPEFTFSAAEQASIPDQAAMGRAAQRIRQDMDLEGLPEDQRAEAEADLADLNRYLSGEDTSAGARNRAAEITREWNRETLGETVSGLTDLLGVTYREAGKKVGRIAGEAGKWAINVPARWQDIKTLLNNFGVAASKASTNILTFLGKIVSGEHLYNLTGQQEWLRPAFKVDELAPVKYFREGQAAGQAAVDAQNQAMAERAQTELMPLAKELGFSEEEAKQGLSFLSGINTGVFQNMGDMSWDLLLGWATGGMAMLSELRNVSAAGAANIAAAEGGKSFIGLAWDGIKNALGSPSSAALVMNTYTRNTEELAAEKGGFDKLTSEDHRFAMADSIFNTLIEIGGGDDTGGVEALFGGKKNNLSLAARLFGPVPEEMMEEVGQGEQKKALRNIFDFAAGRDLTYAKPIGIREQNALIDLAEIGDTLITTAAQTLGMDAIYVGANGLTNIVNKAIAGKPMTTREAALGRMVAIAADGLQQQAEQEEQHDAFEGEVNQDNRGNDRTPGTDQRAQAAAEEEAAGNQGAQTPKGNPKDMRAVREATERKAEADQAEQEFRAEQDKMLELERKNASPEELDAQQAILDQAKAKLDQARDRYHQAAELANQESTLVPEEGYTAEEVQNIVNNGGTAEGQRKQEPNRPVKDATDRTADKEAPQAEEAESGQQPFRKPERPVKSATERQADETEQTLVEAEQNVQNAELMLREAQAAQAQAVMAAKEEGLEADERARREQAAQDAIKRTEALQKEYDQARAAADAAVRDQQEQAESRENQQNSQESELVMNGEGPGPVQERPGYAGEEQEKPEKKPAPRPENELTPDNPEPPTPVDHETPQTAQDDRQEGTPQEEEVQQELVNNGEGPGPDQVRPGNEGEEQEKPGRKPAPVPEQEKTEVTQGQGQEQAQTPQTAQDNRQTGTPTEAEEEEGIGKQEEQTGLTEEKTENGKTDTDDEEETKRRQQKTADDINDRYGFNKRSTDGGGKTRPGLTVNSWDGEVSDSQRVELQVIHDYAKEHGFSVIVDSSIKDPNVRGRINGQYISGQNGGLTIQLAQNGTQPLRTTLGHELYHMIKNLNKDGARRIEKLYRDLAGRQGVDVERLITNKLVEYRGMGIELSPYEAAARTAALEEVIADSMYDIIGDERTVRALAMQDRSLAERIMDWVDRMMKDIHKMLDKYGSSRAEAKVLHDQYGAMENMRAAVERALAETKELRDAKKAATSLGSNSRMLDEYRSAMDAAESREDMNAATLALAGQVLEKAGVEQSWENIRKLLTGAAEYAYGGGAVSQVLNEYGMNTWIPSDEANRAFVSIGRYMKQMLDAHDEAGYAQILGMDQETAEGINTDSIDSRYMRAVKEGDTKEQRSLVQQAAEQNMAKSKMRTKDGRLRIFYHGTNADGVTVFSKDKIGTRDPSDRGWFGKGFYFAFNRDDSDYQGKRKNRWQTHGASHYGRNIIGAYLNAENPFNYQSELETLGGISATHDGNNPNGRYRSAVVLTNLVRKFPEALGDRILKVYDGDAQKWNEVTYKEFADRFYQRAMEYHDLNKAKFYQTANIPLPEELIQSFDFAGEVRKQGYDAIIESEDGDEAVVFDSSQIKSADPVTYDDAGNVIPLSERFNEQNPDIRYSAEPETVEDPSIRDVKDGIRYSMDADGARDMVDLGSDIARADQSAWQLIDTIRQMKMRMTQDADGAAQQTPGYWKKMTGEIAKSLQEYTYGKDQKTVEKAVRELFSALDGYDGDARGFVEFALRQAQSTMRDLYTDDAENPTRDNLKAFFEQHGPLYVTPEQKKELQYFAGGMTAFRRQAAGLVPITSKKTGVGLEEIWSELAPLIGKDPDIVSVGTMIMEFNDAVEKARSVNGMERTLSDEEIAMLDRRALDLVAEYMQAGATVVPTRTVEKIDADRHQEALKEVSRLQEETDKQQEEIDRLNRKLEQADAANQSLNRQVFDRAEVIEQLKQGGATRAEVEEARAAYRAKAEEAAQAVQAMKDIQKKLEEARAKRDQYRKELAQARRAEQAYEKAQHQIERLQAGRDSLKKQIEKLKLQAMDTRLRARQMKERRSLLDSVRKIGGRMRNMLASPSEAKGYIPMDHVRAVADLAEAMVNNDGRASAAKMSRRLENAIRDARESNDYNTSRMYEDELNEAMREVTKLLEDKGSLNNLSNTELEFVSDTLTAVETSIRNSNMTIGREKNEALGKESADAIRVMRENPRDLKGLGRLIRRGVLTQLNPQRFFAIWGHHEDNAITRMGEEASEGQRKKNKLMMDMTKKFEALTQGKNEKLFDKFTGKHATWYDTGIQILNEDGSDSGRTWKMNGAMRAFFGLSWQAEENREGMRTGARSETGGELYQLTIPDEELMKKGKEKEAYARGERVYFTAQQAQAILDEMTDYEKSWMDAWREMEKLSKAAINETSMLLYGFRKAKVGNYVPIFRDPRYIGKEFEAVVTDSRLTSMGFMHERVNAHNPMMLMDLTNVINRQVRDVSDLYGFAVPTRNMTRIYNGKMAGDVTSVKEVINKTQGMEVGAYFEKLMGDLQGGSRVESSIFDKVRGNVAGAVLAGNPSVIIKQAASYPAAAAVLGWKPLMKAMRYFNPIGLKGIDVEHIDQCTSALWERRSRNLSDLEANANRDTPMSKTLHKLLNGIQGMDIATTKVIWRAAEYYVEENNKDLKRGTEEFNQAVARVYEQALEGTQPEYGTMQRPQVLRSTNQLVKSVTMYKTQSLQNFGILVDAATNYTDKKAALKRADTAENRQALQAAKGQLAAAVSSQVTSAVILAVMTALGKALLHKLGGYRDDKGDLTAESVGGQLLRDSASSVAGMVVGGSELFDLVTGLIDGQSPFDIEAAGVSTVNDLYQQTYALLDAARVLADGDATPEQKLNQLLPKFRKLGYSIAQMKGIPVQNVLNLLDGIAANTADFVTGKPGSFASASPLAIAGTPVIGSAQGRETGNKAVAGYIAQAMMDGNEAEATRLYNEQLRQGKKADALNTAIATWQKENIPEIREAAQAIDNGYLTEYNRLINELTKMGLSMTNAVKYVEAERKKMQDANISVNGNVNVNNRKQISGADMARAGWNVPGDSFATLYSSTFNENGYTVLATPIESSGQVLTQKEFDNYVFGLMDRANSLEELLNLDKQRNGGRGLLIAATTGETRSIINAMNDLGEQLHNEHEAKYGGYSSIKDIVSGMTKATSASEDNAYTNGMMNSLLEDGNVDAAKAIRDDMIANGKKAASINSSLTSYWKPLLQAAYDNGDMAEVRRITAMLVEMGLKRTTVSGWTQEKSGSSSSSSKKKSGFGSWSFGSGSFGSSKKSSKKSGFGSGSFGSGKFGS